MKQKYRVTSSAGGKAFLLALGLWLCAAGQIRAAAPNASNDSVSTTEDNTLVTINALANDSITDPVTVTFNTNGTQGAVSHLGNGSFSYNPFSAYQRLKTGETASDTFTYTLTDTNNLSDTATVTITVQGINDAPSITGIITSPQVVNDNATVLPFSGASIVDPDLPVQSVTVLIVLDDFRPGTFTGSGVRSRRRC